MDLGKIKSADRDVVVPDPYTGGPTGLTFHLRSPDSPEVKKVQREWQDRMLSPKRRRKNVSSAEAEAFQDSRIVAQVVGWKWTDEETVFNDEQPEPSDATLRKWLKEYTWLRDFLVEETEDLTAFLTGQGNS